MRISDFRYGGQASCAGCVFPFGLVSECVAIVVLQREHFVLRPNDHGKRAVLFGDGNLAKEIVLAQRSLVGDRKLRRVGFQFSSGPARCISALEGKLLSTTFRAVSIPATGKVFGSSKPSCTKSDAWSQ